MQIFIRLSGQTQTYQFELQDKINSITSGFEPCTLIYGGKPLDSSLTFEDYNILPESTLEVIIPLDGGKKKHKRKVYTTPKKIKRKHKKVKLAVLKYYKVDASEKVTRLKKECPAPSCGGGVFMAKHKERHYCGRCGITYKFNE